MKDLNILIVGAGVAGLTCAALLKQRGVIPLIVEKETEECFNTTGYMLGLLPLGGRVILLMWNMIPIEELKEKNSLIFW